tara:strand:+ start:779 stop:1228 length:450 start_codon:yes stop_codon:yes gene_type:complete
MSSLYYDEIGQRLQVTKVATATTPRTASPSNLSTEWILGKRPSPHAETSATPSSQKTAKFRKSEGVSTHPNAENAKESRTDQDVSLVGAKRVAGGVCWHANGSVSGQPGTATTDGTGFCAPENQFGNTTDELTQVSRRAISSTRSRSMG